MRRCTQLASLGRVPSSSSRWSCLLGAFVSESSVVISWKLLTSISISFPCHERALSCAESGLKSLPTLGTFRKSVSPLPTECCRMLMLALTSSSLGRAHFSSALAQSAFRPLSSLKFEKLFDFEKKRLSPPLFGFPH